MENLDVCPELSLVDLQNCRILEIDGLDKLPNLTSLHLAHNGITEIKNLEKNVDLDTIDLSGNPITSLAGLDGLDQLEDLWMNDCKIEDWKEVEKLERMNTVLITLEYFYFIKLQYLSEKDRATSTENSLSGTQPDLQGQNVQKENNPHVPTTNANRRNIRPQLI